jgi:hypothetical protein
VQRGLKKAIYILILYLFLAQESGAQDGSNTRYNLNGYVKALPSLTFDHVNDTSYTLYILHNRINQRLDIGNNLSLRLEMRNRYFGGSYVEAIPGYREQLEFDPGLVDLNFTFGSDKHFIHTVFDRVQVDWYKGPWELTLGRQRVNWGVNTVWNPNDLFNVFNFLDFDYVERPGSDAVRVARLFDNMQRLELVVSPGPLADDDIVAFLYGFNYKTYDVQFIGGKYRDNVSAGVGWAGNLGKAGWKGELTWFHPYRNFSDTISRISVSSGFDYIFANGIYAQVAWLYNEVNAMGNLSNTFQYTADARQLMPFEHTLLLQASYPVNPLINLSLATMYEPENHGLIIFPTLSWSLGDNLVASLIAQSFLGEMAGYQAISTAVFLDVKWNFALR